MANQVKERLMLALEITCGYRGTWDMTNVQRDFLLGEHKTRYDLQTTQDGRIGTIKYTAMDIVKENLPTLEKLINGECP